MMLKCESLANCRQITFFSPFSNEICYRVIRNQFRQCGNNTLSYVISLPGHEFNVLNLLNEKVEEKIPAIQNDNSEITS